MYKRTTFSIVPYVRLFYHGAATKEILLLSNIRMGIISLTLHGVEGFARLIMFVQSDDANAFYRKLTTPLSLELSISMLDNVECYRVLHVLCNQSSAVHICSVDLHYTRQLSTLYRVCRSKRTIKRNFWPQFTFTQLKIF